MREDPAKGWKVPQKINRLFKVRVKRWCKRPPVFLAINRAGKPHLEQNQVAL